MTTVVILHSFAKPTNVSVEKEMGFIILSVTLVILVQISEAKNLKIF